MLLGYRERGYDRAARSANKSGPLKSIGEIPCKGVYGARFLGAVNVNAKQLAQREKKSNAFYLVHLNRIDSPARSKVRGIRFVNRWRGSVPNTERP